MTKNKYKHFNPETHKIESKIATVRRGHHCKFNMICPKCGYKYYDGILCDRCGYMDN